MTIWEHRRLRISIATLGLLVAGAVGADRVQAQECPAPATCVRMTLNANVQLTKLHPAVSNVILQCTARAPGGINRRDSLRYFDEKSVVNRGYSGSLTAAIDVPRSSLALPANRTMDVTCELALINNNTVRLAVASAAVPALLDGSNDWHVVATGSNIKWTQALTFPSVP
jgi:hypothetical protein